MTLDVCSSASEMIRSLRAREISAVELLEMHFARFGRLNSELNAIVIPNWEEARRRAAEADAACARGDERPLLGLPFTVKDWIEVEGWRTTAGDRSLGDYRAKADSRIVARLKAAGAVLFGKTNMAPWGGDWQAINPVFGRTNNPWALDRTPGGSTGGGAAAVAAGLSPLELGNDIGGSVRLPPAFCGIYGHRPSETALPRTGQTPDFSGEHLPNPARMLAVVGPLARDAADLALALDVAAGPDKGEDVGWNLAIPPARHDRLSEFRVAILPPIDWVEVDLEIAAALDDLATRLSGLGARVERVQPDRFGDWREHHLVYQTLLTVFTTGGLSEERRLEWLEDARLHEPKTTATVMALQASAQDFLGWLYRREVLRDSYRRFFVEWDVLLTPMTTTPAFPHKEHEIGYDETVEVNGHAAPYGDLLVYPGVATYPGHPATAFPFGLTRGGLPIGLQAVGPYLEDHTPIRFAEHVAREFGGFITPPRYTPV